jgi:CubicO group peptidase (beta-lactamase class C family)
MKVGKLYQNKIWLAFSLLLLSVLLIPSVFSACSQSATITNETPNELQTVQPEDVGLSSAKLNEIDTQLQADIAEGKIPGAVLLIARHGKIAYFKSFGYRDNDKQLPMEKDSIFRLYSMTKSLTAASIATLKDEGKLAFDDPVAKYIPAFKDVQVGEVTKDEEGNFVVTRVPPTTVMTIQHLATHTSGLDGALGPKPGITELYTKAGLNNTSGLTNEEIADKLAQLPLCENPGTVYRYGSSYDVLGRVIEVASGMTLDKFFEENIYKPLGMTDSGFWVTPENVDRLVYLNPQWPFFRDVTYPNVKNLNTSYGTVSTAMDWARFAQMLLNGGEFEGKRLINSETEAYITSDLIGPLGNRSDAAYVPGPGYGVGFDFYVLVDPTKVDYPANIGTYMKEGIAGTTYSIDPKEDLFAVFMLSTTTQRQYYRDVVEKMIYQSIID